MKYGLCAIVKNENLYLREWVEHYKKLGFYKIYLYDNNDTNGEYPHMVIGDYIDDGFVVYHNWRGVKDDVSQITKLDIKHNESLRINSPQYNSYRDCFNKHKEECDWMFFFDVDEFLWVTENETFDYNMSFISENTNEVWFQWEMIGDADNLFYDDRPVRERFKNGKRTIYNKVKYGIRTDSTGYKGDYNYKDGEVHLTDQNNYIIYNSTYIKIEHYITKSISEYISRKFTNGYANNEYILNENNKDKYLDRMLEIFSTYSNITDKKKEIANNIFNNYISKV